MQAGENPEIEALAREADALAPGRMGKGLDPAPVTSATTAS